MTADPPGHLVRRKRRWLIATCLSGFLLALCIIAGLGATVWRLQQTMDLVDDLSTSDTAFQAMVDRALAWSKIGLAVGGLAFCGYLYSFFMHHRLKEQIKSEREERRRLALLDPGPKS